MASESLSVGVAGKNPQSPCPFYPWQAACSGPELQGAEEGQGWTRGLTQKLRFGAASGTASW